MTIADPYKVVDKHILTIFATNVPHFKIFATKVSLLFSPMKNHPKYIVFKCFIQKHFFELLVSRTNIDSDNLKS